MSEKMGGFENAGERILSREEIFEKFLEILAGREFVETHLVEDSEGIKAWDVATKDSEGNKVVISYERQRTFPNGVYSKARIDETCFDSDDFPTGAGDQYVYEDSVWKKL